MGGRWIAALAALALAACAQAPAPDGPAPLQERGRSAAEQRLGDQAHPQILAQYGGAYDGPVSDYVARLGRRLAEVTAQPEGPWTFTVLDSPVVNAFALPGGYVYVTRGLVALAKDEAELAGVVGHEIGHVTAAHTAERQSRAAVAQAGLLATMIGAAVLGADRTVLDLIGQGAGAAAQGTLASFNRAQELEADRLGVEYLRQAGYDPAAQADFLRAMQAQSDLSARLAGGRYDPNRVDFFATHPATAERVRLAQAAALNAQAAAVNRNEAAFLAAIEGMTYGDSAAQGFARGQRFIHPGLRFAFTAADGFTIANAADRITLRGPRGASVVFDGGRDPGGPLEAALRGWAGEIARRTRAGRLEIAPPTRIGGLEAASAAMPVAVRGGAALAQMTLIRAPGGRLWRFFGLSALDDRAAQAGVRQTAQSFEALSARQAAAARPWRIAVRTVRPGDTVASLAARTPFEAAAEDRFRVLNGLAPGQGLTPGQRVKLVVE